MTQDRRCEQRVGVCAEGFFIQEGVLWEIKLKDAASQGVGAYCNRELQPGDRGLVSAGAPEQSLPENAVSEVVWCMAEPDPEDSFYEYRVGIKLLE